MMVDYENKKKIHVATADLRPGDLIRRGGLFGCPEYEFGVVLSNASTSIHTPHGIAGIANVFWCISSGCNMIVTIDYCGDGPTYVLLSAGKRRAAAIAVNKKKEQKKRKRKIKKRRRNINTNIHSYKHGIGRK